MFSAFEAEMLFIDVVFEASGRPIALINVQNDDIDGSNWCSLLVG